MLGTASGDEKRRGRENGIQVLTRDDLELLRPAGSCALSQAGDSMKMTSLVTSHIMCTPSLVSAELA